MIPHLLHIAVGIALLAAGWLFPRQLARAQWHSPAAVLLDASPFLVGGGLALLASGRPLFCGVVAAVLGAGFALADVTMRETLREPVLFTAAAEFPQLFTHPHLYLPFAGTGTVTGGAAAAAVAIVALRLFEPPAWPPHPLIALALAAALARALWIAARPPWLDRLATALRRLRPSGEPFADAAALGPFAVLGVHGVIARAERGARRARYPVPAIRTGAAAPARPAAPLVLVQCESFFDARRLLPSLPPGLLGGFDACAERGGMFGRLDVGGWGANTMRAEFAVLSGIDEAALGYDRFNPYYAFARAPVASQVWRLRQAGWRTICLHPFDRRFFRRDLALPALGFEQFLCRRTLGGSRRPPYYADPDLAADILRVLDKEGPRTFVFAITMGNHGPWPEAADADPDLARMPQGRAFASYLAGLKRCDEMLRILMDGLGRRGDGAVLGFYGDHLPALPHLYAHLGFAEAASDYVVHCEALAGQHRFDMPAHELGRRLVDAVLGAAPLLPQPAPTLAAG